MTLSRISRRRFLHHTSALAASAAVAPTLLTADAKRASGKLNIAVIGLANRAAANLGGVASENIVALCDVDEGHAAAARKQFPKAEFFADYRKLFEKVRKQIDAVVVSTPDHSHFHPAFMAVELGKHV